MYNQLKKIKEIKKSILMSTLSLLLLFSSFVGSYAAEVDSNQNNLLENSNTISENISLNDKKDQSFNNSIIELKDYISITENKVRSINPVRYRKENVRKTREYSGYKRASRSVGKNFTVSVDRSVTFSITTSGAEGLYSLGFSISHRESISRKNTSYKSAYIGCRCIYSVERGTRVVYNAMNGKVLGKNPYVVKKPIGYQYELLREK